MWPVLRTELAYARNTILGSLGLAAGVSLLVTTIFALLGDKGPPDVAAAGIRTMFLVMAPLITGFVIQAFRNEERRIRLLLATPATPRQIVAAQVLLPVALLAVGLLAGGLAIAGERLVTGRPPLESFRIAGKIGGLLFLSVQFGLLIQEAITAYQQGRKGASALGWAVLVTATVPFPLGALLGRYAWLDVNLYNVVGVLVMMAATVALFSGRRDFTR